MIILKRWLNAVSVIACILSCSVLYGCGASSLVPQEPSLPTIDGLSEFSDRFQLEEAPQFFYDPFGKELLEGNEAFNYRERKEFDRSGELIAGWTGQLDSERFSAQLDRTILTTDSFRERHSEFAIGDNMRIKPSMPFLNRHIIYETESDGFWWGISFSQERRLFTFLGPQEPLSPTIERQSEFSNRIYLEEEPQNFYDLFGDELLNGNKSSAEICRKD